MNISEPVKIIGEGLYNLNDLKEIVATDSFLGMDEEKRKCQNEEPHVCTTRQYVNTYLEECGCLPLSMKHGQKVLYKSYHL